MEETEEVPVLETFTHIGNLYKELRGGVEIKHFWKWNAEIEVRKQIYKMKNKSPGPDNICPWILKD